LLAFNGENVMHKASIVCASSALVVMFGLAACADKDNKAAAAAIPQPTSYEGKPGKPGQLICHPIVHEGEVTGQQECHTQAGWDRLRHEYTLKTMNDVQRNSLTGSRSP
jgi:hypothetical protein